MKALVLLYLTLCGTQLLACIWDADTLTVEKWQRPDLAKTIFGVAEPRKDSAKYAKKIAELQAAHRESDAAWWNELAGAMLRSGRAAEAAALLEPVISKFPNDYGLHANLGTAYHLLGRYADAEREIARDLEIDPNAHYGLEKYHLALLQYLMRDSAYQKRHVYVDEFTIGFLRSHNRISEVAKGIFSPSDTSSTDTNGLAEVRPEDYADGRSRDLIAATQAEADTPPAYRFKWNLAEDPKLDEGLLYMAGMNQNEPACIVMLGVSCMRSRNYNLAVAAFQRALDLRSPQADLLQRKITALNNFIRASQRHYREPFLLIGAIAAVLVIAMGAYRSWRRRRRAANT
ncbi:MAG TPA: tetratricopeptide repeat protein [Candidatus Acidoferrum sp.]|nr:tetratricopeptide repeat protein [Candidatus Acidoferrum sp.]